MGGKARDAVREYDRHMEASRQEADAARQVVADMVDGLSDLLYGREICAPELRKGFWRLQNASADTAMGRYHRLVEVADEIQSVRHYDDEYDLAVEDGGDGDEVVVIRGYKEWSYGEGDGREARVPAWLVGMSEEEVDALYDKAASEALDEMRAEDERERRREEERERRRYLELKAKYGNEDEAAGE